MVAYGSFLFAVYAFAARGRNRVLLGVCAALGVINVLFVGDGRTGQVVLLVLALYFGAWCAGRRGAAVGTVLVFAIGAVAYAVPGSSLHNRIALAISDFVHWQPGVHAKPSGVTERLEFHKRGMQIVSEHPLVGVGTGGFAVADRQRAVAAGLPPARHPHNEYLLKAVELGVIGPLLMLIMFGVQWRKAAALPLREHQAIARGLVLMFAVGSFGTSMLRDHAEALLFVWMSAVLFATLPAGARPRP
jgi:O-antigen ligase